MVILAGHTLHNLIMQQKINDNVTVQIMFFEKEQDMTKHGKKEKLNTKSQAAFILNFPKWYLTKNNIPSQPSSSFPPLHWWIRWDF